VNPKAAEAVQALARIRVAETRGADGLRRVWHQAADVDLLSWVDEQGKLLRQELTLFGDHYQWTSDFGLRTGQVGSPEGSAAAAHASDLVALDTSVSKERLRTAHAALAPYAGDDKYVQHMKHVVAQFFRGLQDRDEVVITMTKETPVQEVEAQHRRSRVGWIVAGAIVALVVATVLLFNR
jgi:hypothetical protein